MADTPRGLNGSADRLAQALRDSFHDAMSPIADEVRATERRIGDRLDETNSKIETTNQNTQSQFAQLRKEMADDRDATRQTS